MLTLKSSLIRALFVAAFACVCVLGQVKTASAQPQPKGRYQAMLDQANAVNGTFAGESICVRNRPNCKTEKVVFVSEPVGQDGREILVTLDFVRGGARVPFAKQKLQRSQSVHNFSGRLLMADTGVYQKGGSVTPGTTFTYTITVTNNGPSTLEGTVTENDIVVQRIKLRRVKPNQIPPAPSSSLYPSL